MFRTFGIERYISESVLYTSPKTLPYLINSCGFDLASAVLQTPNLSEIFTWKPTQTQEFPLAALSICLPQNRYLPPPPTKFLGTPLVVGVGVVATPPSPVPTYESYGPAQLFVDEGQEVLTLSGSPFIKGITLGECADVCSYVGLSCSNNQDQQSCDSFSYRMSDNLCYLKKRGQNKSKEVYYNTQGWQSYSYWGLTSSFLGGKYTGGLPIITRAYRVPDRLYRHAYVSKGPNQLAKIEGQPIPTSRGHKFLRRATLKDCADECDKNTECDAFSYNPYQKTGICYLKRNSNQEKFATVYNDDDWTYYWKETDYQSKCYCSCITNYICIMCDYEGGSRTCDAL